MTYLAGSHVLRSWPGIRLIIIKKHSPPPFSFFTDINIRTYITNNSFKLSQHIKKL